MKKKYIQIEIIWALNSTEANNQLRGFQETYPNRKITSVSATHSEYGWFITIAYEVEI